MNAFVKPVHLLHVSHYNRSNALNMRCMVMPATGNCWIAALKLICWQHPACCA